MTNLPINFFVVFNGGTKKVMLEHFNTREEAVRYIQSIEENLKKNNKYLPYQFAIIELEAEVNFKINVKSDMVGDINMEEWGK